MWGDRWNNELHNNQIQYSSTMGKEQQAEMRGKDDTLIIIRKTEIWSHLRKVYI